MNTISLYNSFNILLRRKEHNTDFYIKYIVDNELFINFEKFISNIPTKIYEYNKYFFNKTHFRVNPTFRLDGVNYILNEYFKRTKDVKPLIEISQSLNNRNNKSNFIELINPEDLCEKINYQFYIELIESFLSNNDFTIPDSQKFSKLLFRILDEKQFLGHKNSIYKLINQSNTDLLTYAILSDYFTKEDFISFIKNPELQTELTKKYLNNEINSSQNVKRINI